MQPSLIISKWDSISLNLQYYLLLFLFIIIPLAITTLTNSRTDLPKSASLVIFGGLFLTAGLLIFCLTYFRTAKGKTFNLSIEYDKKIDPFVFLFLLAAIISTIFSINPGVSFYGPYERQIGLITYIYIFLVYCFSSYIFKDDNKLKTTILIIELTALVVSVYTILQYFDIDPFGIQPSAVKRPVSTLGNSVFTGGFLMLIIPFSVLNISGKKSVLLKIIFPLIITFAVVVTQTRSAYLALFAQFCVFVVFFPVLLDKSSANYKRKIKTYIISLVTILVLVLILILLPKNQFNQRILSIFSENNPRWILWQDSFNIFMKYPFFGPGIGMFPNAYEEFYSFRLREADVRRYFDHAHNNFLQVLFTMGTVGFIAYIGILFQSFRCCIKKIMSKDINKKRKILFLSFLMMFTGYSVYGLTNFDEITITFYFFMFVAMLKVIYSVDNFSKIVINKKFAKLALIFPVIIIFLFGYNIYNSVKWLKADNYFLNGMMLFSEQKFAEGVLSMNNAIIRNKSCPNYRFILANNVYKIAASNNKISPEGKNHLLKQAADETIKARENYFNKNECDGLLSLIYYEVGRKTEADSIKNDVLRRNSINVGYRINLALYYLRQNNFEEAKDNIDSALTYDPLNTEVLSVAAYYYIKTNNFEEAKGYCNKVLSIDPGNAAAKELLKQIK